MSRQMTSHLSTSRKLLALAFNCIAHGEEIDSLPPLQKKAHADVNEAQSGNLAKKLVEVRLQFSAQTFADLLEQQSPGLHGTQVDLRWRKSFFASDHNQVTNDADS